MSFPWDDSTSTVRGYLFIQKEGAPGSLLICTVTGTLTDNGTWDTFSIGVIVSSGSFSNNDNVRIWFQKTGNDGAAGATGATGATGPTGATGAAGADGLIIPGCRLTCESHVPVSTSDQANATTLYYTAFKHGGVPLYDGSSWATHYLPAGQISAAVPTAVSSAKPYDVFVFLSSGTPTLEFLAWTNNTTRATNIINTSSPYLYTKSGDATRLYVGTIYADTSGQTQDTLRKRHVWNMFNRVPREFYWVGPGTDWTYTNSLVHRYVNGGTAPSFSLVVGLPEETFSGCIAADAWKTTTSSTAAAVFGFAVDVTNSISSGAPDTISAYLRDGGETDGQTFRATLTQVIALGYHEINWLERVGATSVTLHMRGTNNDEAGMHGTMRM